MSDISKLIPQPTETATRKQVLEDNGYRFRFTPQTDTTPAKWEVTTPERMTIRRTWLSYQTPNEQLEAIVDYAWIVYERCK